VDPKEAGENNSRIWFETVEYFGSHRFPTLVFTKSGPVLSTTKSTPNLFWKEPIMRMGVLPSAAGPKFLIPCKFKIPFLWFGLVWFGLVGIIPF
jgi:hypothetical protein